MDFKQIIAKPMKKYVAYLKGENLSKKEVCDELLDKLELITKSFLKDKNRFSKSIKTEHNKNKCLVCKIKLGKEDKVKITNNKRLLAKYVQDQYWHQLFGAKGVQ